MAASVESVSNVVTVECWKCVHVTARAIIVKLSEYSRELVVPESVVHETSEVKARGDRGKLVVARWWAEREKLA